MCYIVETDQFILHLLAKEGIADLTVEYLEDLSNEIELQSSNIINLSGMGIRNTLEKKYSWLIDYIDKKFTLKRSTKENRDFIEKIKKGEINVIPCRVEERIRSILEGKKVKVA